MKRMAGTIAWIVTVYIIFCGFAIQKGKKTANTDKIIHIICPVINDGQTVRPDLTEDFYNMGLAFTKQIMTL